MSRLRLSALVLLVVLSFSACAESAPGGADSDTPRDTTTDTIPQ